MMIENTSKVTVLMPAYNVERYIEEAIESVLEQSFTDFNLLIVNDGSTDNTEKIIRSFTDERIILINQPHRGIASALNKGIFKINSDYIARFDADDICFPTRLEEQVIFLDTHQNYILVGSDAEYISEEGEHLFDFKCIGHTYEEINEKFYSYCPFIHSSVMYRKYPVRNEGGYCLHAHNFEDYFLWLQIKKYGKFHNLPHQLTKVRFNPASVTIDDRWRSRLFRQMKRDIIIKNFITQEEGDGLAAIIKQQDVPNIKEGAYYALCGKKFLLNNYQPLKARCFLSKAIRLYPFRLDNYALYVLSFFPGFFIKWLYQKKVNKIS